MTISEIRSEIDHLKGKRGHLLARLGVLQAQDKALSEKAIHIAEAKELLRSVAIETQEQLRYHVSEIASLAMDAVLDEPYDLIVDFVAKRGKTECELWFLQDGGERIKPLDASGGGAVDVAAFALRVAIWTLKNPRTRPVIILDEPFRFLSTGLQPRAAEMIKELSQRLNIQFIMVTHSEILTEGADKVFRVIKKKGSSVITE